MGREGCAEEARRERWEVEQGVGRAWWVGIGSGGSGSGRVEWSGVDVKCSWLVLCV